MNALVTIIVPVFRTEKFLNRCIDSIINQTYKHLEIILVDDGSDDCCPQICDIYKTKDSRVKVIHKKNGGLSSARNYGIDNATGAYISFVDSDDYIAPDMIELLINSIVRNKADIAMVKYKEVKNHKLTSTQNDYNEKIYTGREIEIAFQKLKIDSVCVGLYKRDCIADTRFLLGKTSEDIPFNFEVFKACKKFVYIPIEKYYYYSNPDSISNGKLSSTKFNYLNFRIQIYNFYKNSSDEELSKLSSVLVARAAMGLLTRMALFGLEEGLNERDCLILLKNNFEKYKNEYYYSDFTPLSRKILAFIITNFYPLFRFMGRL